MTAYATLASKATIPQSEPLDARQVQNNAGGFVFEVDQWARLNRFLILGSDANTYYQTARALTRENAGAIERCWADDPARTATMIVDISDAGRAPKNDPAIFAVVLGTLSPNEAARKAAYAIVGKVCRTGTHLFQFVKTAKALGKGFGRGMKRAVDGWYLNKSLPALAKQLVKYRSRDGLSHENVLDMSRPTPDSHIRNALFKWAVGKLPVDDRPNDLPAVIGAHERAMATTTAKELLPILKEHPDLPWEALPTWANADVAVKGALLPNMGLTALVRQLGTLTRIGVIAPLSDESRIVRARLSDADEIAKSRIHPMQVLTAMKIYASGRPGMQNRSETGWTPDQKVVDALNWAFYASFKNVEPSGKRFLIGLDISGSMGGSAIGNANMTAREATAAMSMVVMKTEPETHIMGFSNTFIPLPITPSMRLDDIVRKTSNYPHGSTDCSLPMLYAMEKGIKADVFLILTDNETWAGRMHPAEALRQYRRKMNIPAKLIVAATTATQFSIADPNDAGMLDIVGFDSGIMPLITQFAA